jgi:hypothetical protein
VENKKREHHCLFLRNTIASYGARTVPGSRVVHLRLFLHSLRTLFTLLVPGTATTHYYYYSYYCTLVGRRSLDALYVMMCGQMTSTRYVYRYLYHEYIRSDVTSHTTRRPSHLSYLLYVSNCTVGTVPGTM